MGPERLNSESSDVCVRLRGAIVLPEWVPVIQAACGRHHGIQAGDAVTHGLPAQETPGVSSRGRFDING